MQLFNKKKKILEVKGEIEEGLKGMTKEHKVVSLQQEIQNELAKLSGKEKKRMIKFLKKAGNGKMLMPNKDVDNKKIMLGDDL